MLTLILFFGTIIALIYLIVNSNNIWNYKIISINDTDLVLTKGPFHRKQIHYKKQPSVSILDKKSFVLHTDGWFTESGDHADWYKLSMALENLQKVLNLQITIKELWSKK